MQGFLPPGFQIVRGQKLFEIFVRNKARASYTPDETIILPAKGDPARLGPALSALFSCE